MSQTVQAWNNTTVKAAVGIVLITVVALLLFYFGSPEGIPTGGVSGGEITD